MMRVTGGLEIVAALLKITLHRLAKKNDQVIIDFSASAAAGDQYQLQEIPDLAQ